VPARPPECVACGSARTRLGGRFAVGGRLFTMARCDDPGCRLVFRFGEVEERTGDGAGGREPARLSEAARGEAAGALVGGLRACLAPPAEISLPEDDEGARAALESAGYTVSKVEGRGAVLLTRSLVDALRPGALLEERRERLPPEGVLLLHVPRFEDVPAAAGRLRSRHLFRPSQVGYFSLYSLVSLLWRSGLLVEEWSLDEEERSMTIRAVSHASVPPLTGGWEGGC